MNSLEIQMELKPNPELVCCICLCSLGLDSASVFIGKKAETTFRATGYHLEGQY